MQMLLNRDGGRRRDPNAPPAALPRDTLLAAGTRPDVVTERLGDSSVAFTLGINAQVNEGDQCAAPKTMLGQ
jgi:hypothetical protein